MTVLKNLPPSMREQTDSERKLSVRAVREAHNSLDATLVNLRSSLKGLTDQEAQLRLEKNGRNEVAHDSPVPALQQFLHAFANPFIVVLLALAAVSLVTDIILPLRAGNAAEYTGVVIIVTMVLLSAALRFWQEYRSGIAAEGLRAMVHNTATVLRRRSKQEAPLLREIPISEIVVGDIVRLSAGDMIPADLRLIESRDLFVSQAALTGEALPVEKSDSPAPLAGRSGETDPDTELGPLDVSNACFMGTNVVSGTATALVVATGATSYFGSLAKAVVGQRAETSFDRGVNSVSWLLIRFMLVMVPVVFFINGMTKGDWMDAFLFALAVAVGLTPEMLPMIVSSNLAKGAISMARRKAVVKRLNAIQNLGAMDVLCTDKTGTLTEDRIILEHHVDLDGFPDTHALELAWLNSSHQSGVRNLMDRAVVDYVAEAPKMIAKVADLVKIDELPFDFERRRLSVVVEDEAGSQLLVCKGAVEEMLGIATYYRKPTTNELLPITDEIRERLTRMARNYNRQGFRVLLIASRAIPAAEAKEAYHIRDERDLVLHGFLSFLDPPKESARDAIAALADYGVAVKILTGDNAVVTAKICRDIGLNPGDPVLGHQIDAMDDSTLAIEVEARTIFAKLTPLQKTRVLKALQANGHTVGFLGDGINDAPALRDADVGISVDGATDIARESADIILLEKSLLILEEGILIGRETFGNIIKYLNMTASSNFGNVFSVLVASAFLPFLPMLAIHLLIQNLLYDVSQLALPWDRMDKEFLKKPRKWDAENIGRFMIWIGPTSSIFDITTFALLWYVFGANSADQQSLFQSGWFVEGLLSQTLVVHMLRTEKIPFIQSRASLPVMLMTIMVCCLGIMIPFSAFGSWIGLQPLPLAYFPWLVATLAAYCVTAQTMKRIYIRRFGQWF